MELAEKTSMMIENAIKNDCRFVNNEDLYNEFYREIKSQITFMSNITISDEQLQRYIEKVTTNVILKLLKQKDRLQRYNGIQKNGIESSYQNVRISYDNFEFENLSADFSVPNSLLNKIISTVSEQDEEVPEKQYLKIFKLRYDDGMTEKEISDITGLSQIEISRRLFDLMEKVDVSVSV